jgi:asparagine synthase (glutamine-hydrolysing)
MSGLAGIAARDAPLDAMKVTSQVDVMGQVQKHREPDGWRIVTAAGLTYGHDGTDSSESASGLALAFDGKITNASEVRNALRAAGAQLHDNSDRELVLRAWESWGPKCLEQLQGRFAFVLRDSKRATCYLVRDRFGHKPFYYALHDDRIYFASEIKTLLALLAPPILNELALLEWSLYGDVLPPRTLFRGIETLPNGHLREIGAPGSAPESRPYYDITKVVDPERYADYASRSDAEMMDILDATLERVVKNQIEGQRGGVGVLLSGGVDSTMIAAMATKNAEIKAYNFSFWSKDSVLDERRNAEKVAVKLGLPLQSISFDGETYRSELARALWLFETPLWHLQAVAMHLLARRAFADGTRILLSGVSVGPLLLTALDRYRYILPPPFLSHIPAGVLRVTRKAIYSANGLPVATPFFAHNLGFGVRLVDGGKRGRMIARMNETYEFISDLNERRIQVMRMSDNAFFWPRFFRQGDSLCMGESVEYCDAAIDSDFMSLALNLNGHLILRKNKITKWILKELATRYVPRELAFQKKHPVWSVPVDQYFVPMLRESLFKGGFLDSHMGMDWPTVNDMYRQDKEKTQILYRLINIELWGRMFFLGQSVDDVSTMLR